MQFTGVVQIAERNGASLGAASIDVRGADAPSSPLSGRIMPLGPPALASVGVSARYIGVNVVASLEDGRVLAFQWRDHLGNISRARLVAPLE